MKTMLNKVFFTTQNKGQRNGAKAKRNGAKALRDERRPAGGGGPERSQAGLSDVEHGRATLSGPRLFKNLLR